MPLFIRDRNEASNSYRQQRRRYALLDKREKN